MQMQLDVMTLTKSRADVLVPVIGERFQLRMLTFKLSEPHLLHQVGKKRGARAELCIDLQQPAQRRELNLLDIAGAVTAQFPVMS